MAALTKYRVLVVGMIGLLAVQPNDVILAASGLDKKYPDMLDKTKEAVAAALEANGGKIIDISKEAGDDTNADEKAYVALEKEIADLRAQIASATEAEAAPLAALLAGKEQALAEFAQG